jgi:hypothetical protein
MAEQDYSFGEVPVQTAGSTPRKTPAEVIAIANQIWKRVTSSGINKKDTAGADRLLETIQAEFKDFNASFPLVLRWMIQMQKYNSKAFEKYLLMHSSAKLDTREAFLELQAEYLVLLYRAEHHHPDENFVRRYRKSIVQQLLEEDKMFIEMQKQVEKDLEKEGIAIDRDRRQRLYDHILAQKVAREGVMPE